jgi:biotin synthase-related radical SAM superfamily protein
MSIPVASVAEAERKALVRVVENKVDSLVAMLTDYNEKDSAADRVTKQYISDWRYNADHAVLIEKWLVERGACLTINGLTIPPKATK